MTQLKVVFLGTSSAVPTAKRGLSSVAVQRGDELLLFDAGEGAQRAMMSARVGFNRNTKVFISHLHGDHCVGLLGIIQTMSMMLRDKPLEIYGPRGLAGFIKCSLDHLHVGTSFPLRVTAVHDGSLVRGDGYAVKACRGLHSVPVLAYRMNEAPRPGIFYPDRAISLGVPQGPAWSRLQSGQEVIIKGRSIKPQDVMGPPRPGRSIGFSGDTRVTAKLTEFFNGCDLLIFDSTYGDEHAELAKQNMHSTAREAALLSREAGVKSLILTHFSARYDDVSGLVGEAASVHSNVRAAEDLMVVEVPYPDLS